MGLQGSDPDPSGVHNQQAIVTGFTNTGQLKPQWQTRLTQVKSVRISKTISKTSHHRIKTLKNSVKKKKNR